MMPNQPFNTQLQQQLQAFLDERGIFINFTKPRKMKCTKIGHKSKGAAEAFMRSIVKRQELGIMPADWKKGVPLEVYKCKWLSCAEKPWHVGHQKIEET